MFLLKSNRAWQELLGSTQSEYLRFGPNSKICLPKLLRYTIVAHLSLEIMWVILSFSQFWGHKNQTCQFLMRVFVGFNHIGLLTLVMVWKCHFEVGKVIKWELYTNKRWLWREMYESRGSLPPTQENCSLILYEKIPLAVRSGSTGLMMVTWWWKGNVSSCIFHRSQYEKDLNMACIIALR